MSADLVSSEPVAASTPPTTVQAAVVITWLGSVATAGFTVLTVVFWLWAFRDVFDSFDDPHSLRGTLVTAAVVAVVYAVVASLVAWHLMRGRVWAYRALLGLCALSVVLGLVAYFLIVPALTALGAIVVGVLLLLPDSRAWHRAAAER